MATIQHTYTTADPADLPTTVTLLTLARADTGASVSFAGGGAFTDDTGGAFHFDFTAPAAGLLYSYTFRLTWDDASTIEEASTFLDGAGDIAGRYTSQSRLYRRFGRANVIKWSNTLGGTTVDGTAVADAIAWAEDEVDAGFTGGAYTVPLVATGSGLPNTIVLCATDLAGTYLYEKRGLYDSDEQANKLDRLKQAAYKLIATYRGGFPRQLPGLQLRSGVSNAVTIVEAKTNDISTGANLLPTGQSRYTGRRWIQGYGYVDTN